MPKIGMCKSGGWHVILVAAAAFFAVSVVEPVLIAAPTAHAQGATIREIRVAGNRRVEPETVRSYLKFNVGDVYDPGKVDQSIKSLFATSLFSDVRIDREPTGVLVTVVENPVINQVAFEGNSEADKDTLLAEVQLKPRSVFTRARAYADARIVSAGAELDRDGSGFYITFVIDEGEVFKFGTVEIESSVAGVDPKKLYGELFSVGGTTFNQSQLDKSVERLTLTVSEQGLPFARVRPRAARDAAGRLIHPAHPGC